ncbi:unannotated protein [freshwater metagenome]|jgi:hypothetical protein|uniref:Unannotated protein n=1 Tax=freshwater metagenome TaxID=449393 RepID=A0A6J6DK40_9ZZZZ|nr:hypothetical protein [Actinomycetota bacterium]
MKLASLPLAVAVTALAFLATPLPAHAGSTWETVDVSSSPFVDTLADGTVVTVTFGPGGGHWGTTYSPAVYKTDATGGAQSSFVRFSFSQPVTTLKTFYAYLGPGDDETFTTDQGAVNLTQTFSNGGNIVSSSGNFIAGQAEGIYSSGGFVSSPVQDRSGTLELQFETGINWLEVRGMPQGGGGPGINLTGLQLTMSTVSFDANGGEGVMQDQTSASAASLTSNAFTRDGFTFAGWNTAFDGSGTPYDDEGSYPFSIDETLFAQWVAVSSPPAAGSAPVEPSLVNTGLTTWSAVLGTTAAGALFVIAIGAFSARSQLRFAGSRAKLLSVLRRAGLRD